MKAIFLALFAAAIQGFELLSIEREILKQGLHRDIKTRIAFSEKESQCSLVFR